MNVRTRSSLLAARVIISTGLLLGGLVFSSRSGLAAPVTAAQAATVVSGWLKADALPLGEPMTAAQFQGVEAFNDKAGAVLYYVVSLKPAGFVVVPADDLVEPIIAFSSQDTFDPSEQSPLVALLNGDLPGRLAAARGPAALVPNADLIAAQAKWRQFEKLDTSPLETANGLSSISDVRVAPLVATHWAQGNVSGACYNYYTPPYSAGNSGNYICGCVATAFAQLLRYHEYPTTGVGTASFRIYVNGTATTRSLRGGDGAGGPYNWSLMPAAPKSSSPTTAQRQAIGALTADCGVSVNMEYTATASAAYVSYIGTQLINTFHYSRAVRGHSSSSIPVASLSKMIDPNLDARNPVALGIYGTPGGHAIVCDGYGYNSSTLYHHLNMGWSGTSDAWYALPTVDNTYYGTFSTVGDCIYNVFETGTGEIISGRVLYGGAPVAGVTVTAERTGGGTYTATSNSKGIYALARIPSASTYSITASKPGFLPATGTFSTGTSANASTTCGNVFGANFTLVTNPLPVVVSAGRELWDGSKVAVVYSVPVAPATAVNVNNYSINNGVVVTGAAMGATANLVVLSTTELTNGSVCLLSVQNVQDLGGNTMVPVQVSIGTYPNVVLWLKADAGVTTNSSGQASAWADQSGSGNSASPATLSTAPLYVANAFQTRPGLRFDGTSQYLVVPNSPSLAIAGDLTIYAVANISNWASVTAEMGFLGKTAGFGGNIPAPYDYYLVHGTGLPRLYRGNGISCACVNATTNPSVGPAHVFSVVMGGNSVIHYLDGQINGTGTINTTIDDAGTDLCIGSRHDLATKMKGDMAEIIICSSALSDVDRAAIDSYLAAKYTTSTSTNARYFYGSSGCSGGGGSGLWDRTTANWKAADDGICPGNTTFLNGYDAIFGGAAGTVTIPTVGGNPLTANRIEVQTDGYTFVLSLTSGSFRTDLTSGRFTVASGVTTIRQQRAGVWTLFGTPGGTLYVDGPGTLNFADPYTGVHTSVLKEYITGGGTLVISSSGPEPSVPASFLADYYELDNGSTLYFTNYSTTYGANQGLTLGTTGDGGGIIQIDGGQTVTFGAKVTGAAGLTLAGAGTLVLSADNSSTFSGPVTVNGGTLKAAGAGSLGSGNVSVFSGVLELSSATAMRSSASLTLPNSPDDGSVNLNFSGSQTVATLYFSSTRKTTGTWGAIGSGAANTDAAFSGPGILSVTTGQPTTTVLTGSGSPANYGASVTFTARVTGNSPTGTVQFWDGDVNLGLPVELGDGQAQLDVNTLCCGSPHSITAVYSGDDHNDGSTSSALLQTINPITSATLLISSYNPSAAGSNVTFTATVKAAFGTPAGDVVFSANGTPFSTNTLLEGEAQASTASLPLGTNVITAQYAAQDNYLASSRSRNQVVVLSTTPPTTTSLTGSGSPTDYGATVTFTATVTGSAPTGTVQFQDGGVNLGSPVALSGGQAQFSINTLSVPGSPHSITAVYGGDANNSGSTSSAMVQTINPISSITLLTSSLNPSTAGSNVTFTATLRATFGTPAGDVVFSANGTPFGTNALVEGQAQASTASLPVGTNVIVADYATQDNYLASTRSRTQVVEASVPSSLTNAIVGIALNPDGSFTFTLRGTPGAQYYLVTTSDLTQPASSWAALSGSTNTAPSPGGLWSLTVSNAAPQRFYRSVAITPAP